MMNAHDNSTKWAVAVLGLALVGGWTAEAQTTRGPGMSSGSGTGTGAGGMMGGVIRNDSGSISGVGPGLTGSGTILRGQPVSPLPGAGERENLVPFGPGVDVTYPNDPYLIPFLTMEQPGAHTEGKVPDKVTDELLHNARLIKSPGERSLALQRIANGAIASGQLNLAHHVLEEATTASSEITIPLMRDQRLIAIVTSMTFLTDAFLRRSRENLALGDALANPDAAAPAPAAVPAPAPAAPAAEVPPKSHDTSTMVRMAQLEWKRAAYLATKINNPTYRNEMLYKVAESVASGSSSLAIDFGKTAEAETTANRQTPSNTERNESHRKLADALLVDSWDIAKQIDRLIWKYRAMVRIALTAADSRQYARGVELCRGIDNAEARAEAMLTLAESQCRHNQNKEASTTYELAAEAVASVHQEGLRGVLAGFLVDSLIATGRFDDARACIGLYPETSQQLVGLGAIAESQGRRGLAESARRWIATKVPEQYRATLYRRVTSGALWAIEQNRGRDKDLLNRADPLPIP
jgi:hypothetical protein